MHFVRQWQGPILIEPETCGFWYYTYLVKTTNLVHHARILNMNEYH